MKLYKLTDKNGCTYNNTQWGEGVTHTAPGIGELCASGWLHAYEHPLLAVLLNPIHAIFHLPRLWEAEGEVGIRDGQLKCGTTALTTIREIPVPEVTTEQRVKFAILCVLEVCRKDDFVAWAKSWLSGEDRTWAAAAAAAQAAWAAAAEAAAQAAWAAAAAARAAEAEAAEAAAEAAERAATAAVDLITIAQRAMDEGVAQ